jgi:putative hydrolase of the HAD superfamily
MVGDGLTTDVAGGRAAGMRTVWVDSSGAIHEPGQADITVRDLAELLELWRVAPR